jgi:hypothetical protein
MGFKHGFRLNYEGPREPRLCKNLKSVTQYPDIAQQKIEKEIKAGRVAGPFNYLPLINLKVSPIGIVPKKTIGDFRLIHHLSYPEGSSVNDFIDPKLCSVKYTEFDEAIHMVQDLGQNCYLFKMDIKNAFRLLPVHPDDFELLGFMFNGSYYFDKCLPFGCCISPSLFEKFSTFLEYIIKRRIPNKKLLHYLDDFLGGDTSIESCKNNMKIFSESMQEIGVPLADEKSEGPCQVLVYLGLELNSRQMLVRIPGEKIQEVVEKILATLTKKSVKLKNIQSLIGSLNFCCRAIVVGRPFCRRLIDATCGVKRSYHHIRVTNEMKCDLKIWLEFFKHYNGISMFHDRFWISNDDEQLFTDSSGGIGFGIWFKGHWCQCKWPISWKENSLTKDITLLELFPIVIATVLFGSKIKNKKVHFNCDNQSVVCILNTMTSKSPLILSLVRILTMQCLRHNCLIKASHIAGSKNNIADALSRFQNQKFRELAPQADTTMTPMPDHLWNIFSLDLDNWYTRGFPLTLD